MMKALRYIFIRLGLLATIIFASNALYKRIFYLDDVNKFNPTLHNLWINEPGSDIIYFGESSNFHLEKPEAKKVRISDYVQELMPNQKVVAVDNAGLDASNYLQIIRNIPSTSKVHTIIVTMNLRSFGFSWILGENYNFSNRSNVMAGLRPAIINRWLVALKYYDHLTKRERSSLLAQRKTNDHFSFPFKTQYPSLKTWNNAIGNGSWLKDDGSWDMPKIGLASHYVKNFAFQIDANTNPRIHDFDAISNWASKRNVKLVYHLLSDNIEEAKNLVGPELEEVMRYNVDLLVQRYHNGVDHFVVNNLDLVPDSMFVDRHFPTEHYTNKGKKMCAEKLADCLLIK